MADKITHKIYMGQTWKECARALHDTAGLVMEVFTGTDLEEKVKQHYQNSLPQPSEDFMGFYERNDKAADIAMTGETVKHQDLAWKILSISYKLRNLPFLKDRIHLDGIGPKLYLGEEKTKLFSRLQGDLQEGLEIKQTEFGIADHLKQNIYIRISHEKDGFYMNVISASPERMKLGEQIYLRMKSALEKRA